MRVDERQTSSVIQRDPDRSLEIRGLETRVAMDSAIATDRTDDLRNECG
jgi:hypothetical protein